MRKWTRELLNGYIQHPAVTTDAIDNYIIPSSFGQNAGMVGSLTLAHMAYEEACAVVKEPTPTGPSDRCVETCEQYSVAKVALKVAAVAAVVGVGVIALMKAAKK